MKKEFKLNSLELTDMNTLVSQTQKEYEMKHNVENAWNQFKEYKQKESKPDSNLNDEFKQCIDNLRARKHNTDYVLLLKHLK